MSRTLRNCCLTLILLSAVFLCCAVADADEAKEPERIRVGFYREEGYHMVDEKGRRSGYGYEYLQKMLNYTNWQYEYIGYEENISWYEMLGMLERGELDILTSVLKTSEREKDFAYSAYSMGKMSVMLTTRQNDERFSTENYDNWNGIRIGVSEGNAYIASLASYADEHGFSYELRTYVHRDDMLEALKNREIDAALSKDFRVTGEEHLLDKFDLQPFYIITRKGNNKLISEINYAMNQLNSTMPMLEDTLYKKYYSAQDEKSIDLSSAERQFISECKEKGIVFTACINGESEPYSYYDDKVLKGIHADITKLIIERSGLNVNVIKHVGNGHVYASQTHSASDIILDMRFEYNFAEKNAYRLTEPYYSDTIAKLTRRDAVGPEKIVAVIAGTDISDRLIEFRLPKDISELTYYDSAQECVDAVVLRKADAAYVYTKTAEHALYDDETNSLLMTVVPLAATEFSIAVKNTESKHLSSILNKAVLSIRDSDIINITNKYAGFNTEKFSLTRLLYDQPLFIVTAMIVICIILIMSFMLKAVKRQSELEAKNNEMLQDALEKAERANHAKSDFLSRMSHDMRTPMNGILGLAALSKDMDMPQDVRETLAKIENSGQFLLSLINDTLDMNKIENEKLTLDLEPVDTMKMFEETLMLIKAYASEKHIVYKIKQNNINHTYIMADKLRTQQIILNVLSNAVKFSREGGVVEMEMECYKRENGYAYNKFVIRDHGIGISEEFLPKVFIPFEQEYNSAQDTYPGTGLGLAIVKRLVEMMDGSIEVKSEKDEGTEVTVCLKFELLPDYRPEQKKEADISALSGKRVLVCEDHPLNMEIAVRLLEKAGCIVEKAENGEQGVRMFEKSGMGYYDFIIMDIRMPVMDGFEATTAIRNMQREDALTVPIIAMSANAFEEDKEKSKISGMNEHITKPVNVEILYNTLCRYLKD